ncbi:MAG: DMT family transporter [Reyranella sp.]|nr:DMT family transporter [Reyranella sp.]
MTGTRIPRAAWLQLGAAILLFGLAWPAIKLGLTEATPLWFAVARIGLCCATSFVVLALIGRLAWPGRADWPVILSVGVFQIACFFPLANLGVAVVPAGRSGVLAYTMTLWMVPLALFAGERVGWRGIVGALLGLAGVVVIVDPPHFDWSDRAILFGHGCLLLAALCWAIAILQARRHIWRLTPLQVLPWQMAIATVLVAIVAAIFEPDGYVRFDRSIIQATLFLLGVLGAVATWAAVSVARALPPVTSSLAMLGVPLMAIAASVVLVDEPVTWPLAIGSALVIAGIAIVILDRPRD